MPETSLASQLTIALLLASPGVLAAASTGSAGDSHPFTADDLVAMDRVSDPRVSADGKRIVFAVSALDLEANRRRSDLWLVGSDGAGLRRLTWHEENDTSPAWSPDGKHIYFLSTRSGSSQVWRLPLQGGEAEPVTEEPLDVGGFRIAPDGSRLVYSLEVFPDQDVEATRKRLDEQDKSKVKARTYERLFVRHWDTWADGRRSHLFVRPLGGGEARDLMKGMDADAPTKPFGGMEEVAFTPDGKGLVFTASAAGRAEAWSTNDDLFLVPLDGSAVPRSITAASPGRDTGPLFSPDGKTLAYRSMRRAGYEADRFRILLRGWPEGSEREVAPDWDRSAAEMFWSADGSTLYVTADNVGNHSLVAVDAASGKVREVIKEGTVRTPGLAGDRIVYGLDTYRGPVELMSVEPDGSAARALTSINAERLRSARRGEAEQFHFPGAGGDTVHAWLVKPVEFDPARKYPVAFLIHGGPQGSWHNDFHYRWNPQVYAGRGYGALMIDFHGSTGYGQAFTDSIRGDWGGKPLEDLKLGLAAALEKYPWMDGERVAALGASFGGYLINWIAGNWPDRFRCLVSHDGNLDERAAYFNTEELWFPEWDHRGTPWDNPRGYEDQNPVNFVKSWKTPILVIHGAQDFRVVDTQGLSTFTAAQRLGIPSKLLYFPDENHWVRKPQNSLLWHRTVLDWIDRWTREPGKR